jgi:hypothetical protein
MNKVVRLRNFAKMMDMLSKMVMLIVKNVEANDELSQSHAETKSKLKSKNTFFTYIKVESHFF